MIISAKNVLDAAQYRILDGAGRVIPYVLSYDTETQEIEMMVPLFNGGSHPLPVVLEGSPDEPTPVVVRTVIRGSVAVDRDGKIVA